MNRRFMPSLGTLLVVAMWIAVSSWSVALFQKAHAGDSLGISIPGKAHPYGHTYGEWSSAWWTWALTLDDANHPVQTDGEVNCGLGQGGQVWYLAGTQGGFAQRSCAVPAGKALFYPLFNAVFIAEPGDCGPDPCTIEDKLQLLNFIFEDLACNLFSLVDGNPTDYARGQSEPFLAETFNSVFLPEGLVDEEAISDGYWAMIPPLSVGEHTVEFGGALCDPPGVPFFEVGVTYSIEVTPR